MNENWCTKIEIDNHKKQSEREKWNDSVNVIVWGGKHWSG